MCAGGERRRALCQAARASADDALLQDAIDGTLQIAKWAQPEWGATPQPTTDNPPPPARAVRVNGYADPFTPAMYADASAESNADSDGPDTPDAWAYCGRSACAHGQEMSGYPRICILRQVTSGHRSCGAACAEGRRRARGK